METHTELIGSSGSQWWTCTVEQQLSVMVSQYHETIGSVGENSTVVVSPHFTTSSSIVFIYQNTWLYLLLIGDFLGKKMHHPGNVHYSAVKREFPVPESAELWLGISSVSQLHLHFYQQFINKDLADILSSAFWNMYPSTIFWCFLWIK